MFENQTELIMINKGLENFLSNLLKLALFLLSLVSLFTTKKIFTFYK